MKRAIFSMVLLIIGLLFISNALAYSPEITNGLDYLTSTQNMDGSWDNDPYSIALSIRRFKA